MSTNSVESLSVFYLVVPSHSGPFRRSYVAYYYLKEISCQFSADFLLQEQFQESSFIRFNEFLYPVKNLVYFPTPLEVLNAVPGAEAVTEYIMTHNTLWKLDTISSINGNPHLTYSSLHDILLADIFS